MESRDPGEAGNLDDCGPCRSSRAPKHQCRAKVKRSLRGIFCARILRLQTRPRSSRNAAGPLHSIRNETSRFLQPLTRTLHLLKIGDQSLQRLWKDGTLALHLSVAEKREDYSACQFLLLEEFSKTRGRLPRIGGKELPDCIGAQGFEAGKAVAKVVESPSELPLKIFGQDGVGNGPGDD